MGLSANELEDLGYPDRDVFFWNALKRNLALTYGDVSLATNPSGIVPAQANVSTRVGKLTLPTPIISADMDTVTEDQMAIAMATHGGLGIIHYNMTREEQIKQVAKVKHHIHGVIDNPITLSPEMTIAEVLGLKREKWYSFGTFPVVDTEWKLLWLISSSHLNNLYNARQVGAIMTNREDLTTIQDTELWENPIQTALRFFQENPWKNKLPIVNEHNVLKWLITLSDIGRETTWWWTLMARDDEWRLLVGISLQTIRDTNGKLQEDQMKEYIQSLQDKWVDALLVGSAHAHTKWVIEVVKFVKKIAWEVTLIVGNVTSARGVIDLADAGADIVKIWQWPGSICTTRVVAGVGVPQLTAVYLASKAADEKWIQIIADGGITASWDIVKAFAAGAHAVMLGWLLGSADEAPWRLFEIDGRMYKAYRGMWSIAAMEAGSAARYGHTKWSMTSKTTAEWVEAMKPASWPVGKTVLGLVGWIQSGMWYLDASTLPEIREKARFVQMTGAGGQESKVHDVIEVKASK